MYAKEALSSPSIPLSFTSLSELAIPFIPARHRDTPDLSSPLLEGLVRESLPVRSVPVPSYADQASSLVKPLH